MKCLILDMITNRLKWHGGPNTFDWAENNWSCDCSRMSVFGETNNSDYCVGGHRYLIVDYIIETEDDWAATLDEINSDYPLKIREAAYGQYSIFKENMQELETR